MAFSAKVQEKVVLSGIRESSPQRISSSTRDEVELNRLGKSQRLRRDFTWLSILGFTSTLMATWEGTLLGVGPSLVNGGPPGMVWGILVAFAGAILQTLVMAEMASMIPLSGGQYNWVALLAPRSCFRFLSYTTGWMTFLGWQATAATFMWVSASEIQTLALMTHPEYTPARWQVTLLMWAFIAFSLLSNLFLRRLLPKVEALLFFLHIYGFFIVLIVIVYLSPSRNSPSVVFTEFVNGGGWSTNGLSFFVGLSAPILGFVGSDASTHLSEEVPNASAVVPVSMLLATLVNGLTGTAMAIALAFCMGSNADVVAQYIQGGIPLATILEDAIGSRSGAVAVACIPIVLTISGSISVIAVASRMTWAFARENALPFSKHLAKVHGTWIVPQYSIVLTVVICLLLSLLEIGSTAAFSAIYSLAVQSVLSVFLVVGTVGLHKRLTTPSELMGWGPFRLGRCGVPITVAALAYTVVGLFFTFWPSVTNPTALVFNWSVAVYAAAWILALAYWIFEGRHTYKGPLIDGGNLSNQMPWRSCQ